MGNVKSLLESVGSNIFDICKVITYVKNQDTRNIVYPVIAKHLEGVYPVSTGLVVKSLANEELDFEIDVFAVEN
jgi:enamine deaminase RidA (YjgF/YER057c/UK114 family)